MFSHQILKTGYLLVQRTGRDDAHHIGDLDGIVSAHLLLVGNTNHGKGGRSLFGIPLRLDGSQFHLLQVTDFIT